MVVELDLELCCDMGFENTVDHLSGDFNEK